MILYQKSVKSCKAASSNIVEHKWLGLHTDCDEIRDLHPRGLNFAENRERRKNTFSANVLREFSVRAVLYMTHFVSEFFRHWIRSGEWRRRMELPVRKDRNGKTSESNAGTKAAMTRASRVTATANCIRPTL